LKNRVSELGTLPHLVEAFAKEHGVSLRVQLAVNMVLEELILNVISYAYDDDREHDIDVRLSMKDRQVRIVVEEDGREFNPTTVPDKPTQKMTWDNIEDIEFGLALVRMLVDSMHYARIGNRNQMVLTIEDVPGKKTITSMMHENRRFAPPKEFSDGARVKSMEEYKRLYRASIADPEAFWAERAGELTWSRKWDRVLVEDFAEARHEWFVGGKLNVCYNCLDRHLDTPRKNKAALIWEGDLCGQERTVTYQQLHREVCRFANVLRKHGVKKGDRVTVYMSMTVEQAVAVLACARIGAIHSVVFGGFSADALKDRIIDCESTTLICSNGYTRSGKLVRTKDNVDAALASCPHVRTVIVLNRVDIDVPMQEGRDHWWHAEMSAPDISDECECEEMDAEDPLFILYTSGSTGKPKGVLHTTAGYLVYVSQTFKYYFDIREEDTYWCTADLGWVTGHSYIVYGPLANGATSFMFEGVPNYPQPDRCWDIVQRHKISIFYTAPTALRALMREGNQWPERHDLSSLRLLGTVGEPINPEAWMWYHNVIGRGKCPIIDTWWQTETGGILVCPMPGAVPTKPGSATLPFFGIELAVIKDDRSDAEVNEGGWLVIKRPWPGLMRRVYGDNDRFKKTYFHQFHGYYTTGDGARIDEDGYLWIMGRIDDVINVSGHRLGTAEIESALVSQGSVAEAAVVGMPHEIKGQGVYAFVILKAGIMRSDELKAKLREQVRKEIGAIASPDKLQFVEGLPKTRSGKIMRRILTRIAAGDIRNLGDTSTLTDPAVVDDLVANRI
jgi:acetyl-CoA synthetase